MDNSTEFKINEYITLKLVEDRTIIYVKGELFQQCKKLILHMSAKEIDSFYYVDSIDDIVNINKNNLLKDTELIYIPPELEFWGHCSNLQAWEENNYDTRLLHSSLAFPLLKKLTEVGDPVARRVFKEEILKRLNAGGDKVIMFLLKNNYLDYFTTEELEFIYKNNISKFESSKLFLQFLRAFSFYDLPIVSNNYKKKVRNRLLTEDYKEKRRILENHIDILTEEDLIYLFTELKSNSFGGDEKNDRFEVLGMLMRELQFHYHNITFSNSEIITTLLDKEEQNDILNIFNASEYPYGKLDFEADEVRRRVWEEKLYYNFFRGHLMSIELLCNNLNSKEFYNNLKKLKNFKKLQLVNLLFFCGYKYNLIKNILLSANIEKIKIYEFFNGTQIPKKRRYY